MTAMRPGSGLSFWRRGPKSPKRDRREVWQDVAQSIGGTFVPGKRSSGDKVEIAHGPWTIVLDTYTVHTGQTSVTYTRAKAVFFGPVDVRLKIRKRYFFDTLLENVGLGGVDPGHRTFAEKFVVKGRPDTRIRSVVSPQMIEALLAEPKISVSVRNASRQERKVYGASARMVSAIMAGVIREPNRLVSLVTVAKETLSALAAAGMALREPVGGE